MKKKTPAAAASKTAKPKAAAETAKLAANAKAPAKAAPKRRAVKPAPAPPETNESKLAEQVERLAYHYWIERGRPDGSPQEDWFRAEQTLAASPR